ncbi:MAG: GIY-YIG nuclease family protein [bacterium]|nr:GIY-YIG nuclease family protein [bacterium]
MNPKKITVFLADGLPKGVREIRIDQWSGKGLCVPRNKLNAIFQNEEYFDLQNKTCVYFLIGESEEGGLNKVYVGEADGFKQRIKQQESKKDWWKDVMVFISQDDSLTKTGAKYLESICIERLKNAGKCISENSNQPRQPNVPREDISGLELFYENIALIMPLLGSDIFIQETGTPSGKTAQRLYCSGKGATAEGVLLDDGKLRVLKGSEAVLKDTDSFINHPYKALKDELLKIGRIKEDKGKLVFTDDYVFDSPSAAAAIILARSASGPLEWKNKDGQSLKKIFEIK